MSKRIKRLFCKKGLTLVELLVVLVVSSILIACTMGMMGPVRRLLNTSKANAHMDAVCDTVNEYIRGSLQKAEAVSVVIFPDDDADWTADWTYKSSAYAKIRSTWADFASRYKASDGYQLRAIGIMQNYNRDFRLFDFGDVTDIDYSWWGGVPGTNPIEIKSSTDGSNPGNAFEVLLEFRDGGGRNRSWESPPRSGYNGNEFGWFDAFNDDFYSNGIGGEYNYSIQVAFETTAGTLPNGSTGGIDFLKVSTQMFRRKGDMNNDPNITNSRDMEFEVANQMKTLSFQLLNGNAELSAFAETSINSVETVDGAKQIKISEDGLNKDSVVILYVVRDINEYYNSLNPTP